jgi:hypothetical protein
MALKTPSSNAPTKTYADHLQAAPATAQTTVESKSGKNDWVVKAQDAGTLVEGLYHSNGMKVTVEGSHTVPLAPYESARIGVSVTVPCSPENMNDAYNWALGWIGVRIMSEVNKAKGL